ncbi:hypothetical protein [Rahnella sp. Larv3_ips]|uniref:hypothetical protein n=1 Tax=Rahnella sp. Larv3_ips TaxID=1896943 RepID=UPI0013CE48CD|nr:hypothetical protein [Rahnella sp. Larv3_ips]
MFTVQRNLERHRHARRASATARLKKARRVQRGKALSSLLSFGAKSQASTAIEKPKCSLFKKTPLHCPAKAIKKRRDIFTSRLFHLLPNLMLCDGFSRYSNF